MATASTQEVRAATEPCRQLEATVSALFLFTFTLAEVASMRGGNRARIGHALWG
ncbi:hypothetical protein [Halopiger djelfimassiliensis]|uniref:hypothetical protein n=1 Tax=Halopiger djelfimassiliensis TaxID=1293047 RepID=UPI0012B59207|nr:hypothetical protein [Halopiger djelfimassiliensis]